MTAAVGGRSPAHPSWRPSPREWWRAPAAVATFCLVVAVRLLVVVAVGFALFRRLPGDPLSPLVREGRADPAELAARRRELGLDGPLAVQFLAYLRQVGSGDLGTSVRTGRPVAALVQERIGPTLLLLGTSFVLACLIGSATGARAGWRPHGRFDRAVTTTVLALWAMPAFWVGLVLLVLLAGGTGGWPALLPAGGLRSGPAPAGAIAAAVDGARHLLLPCLTLTVVQLGQYHLVMRAAVAAQRGRAHVLLARATGLRDDAVRRRHAVPAALPPVLTLAALNLGFAVSGSVTVEAVFSWPGLGQLALQAAELPDLPLLNGVFLVIATGVVVSSAAADAVVRATDPRLRRAAW